MEQILSFSSKLFLFICLSQIPQSHAIESGSIIPLYIYPTNGPSTWQRLFDAHRENPINTWAIVNVNSGPGGSNVDPNYLTSIQSLHSAGIKTLGYVLTDYARRDASLVKADMDTWKRLYAPHGIFFDEMANDDDTSKVNHYQDLNNYAKSLGFNFTVGNPGTSTSPRYFNTVDNIVTFEKDTGFPTSDEICSQETNGKGRDAVTVLAYNIRTPDYGAVTAIKNCAGYIFVTDDSGDNPWDSLPEYLTQLFLVLKWWE